MSTKIRPSRVSADHKGYSLIVEYFVETSDDATGRLSSEKKQKKIILKDIELEKDIAKLASRIIKKCKYIPESWMDKVEYVLYDLQSRNAIGSHESNDSEHKSDSSSLSSSDMSLVSDRLDTCLEMMYGSIDDKVIATTTILDLCRRIENLDVIVQHHPTMSALSRMLNDHDSTPSRYLTFNIAKIFLALSNFQILHQFLFDYRVGSLIMSIMQLVVKRSCHRQNSTIKEVKNHKENDQNDSMFVFDKRNDNTFMICLSILLRLSDDDQIFQKMLKKGLSTIILQIIILGLSASCLKPALVLLQRTTKYEEVVLEIIDFNNGVLLQTLVYLINGHDNDVTLLCLKIIWNISFLGKCCNQLVFTTNIIPQLSNIITKKKQFRIISLRIAYHLSVNVENRKMFASRENNHFVQSVMQLIINFPPKPIAKELAAVAITLSMEPKCAEQMISYLDKIIHRIQAYNDTDLTKVVCNLSEWTKSLQVEIHNIITCNHKDDEDKCKNFESLTFRPSHFIQKIKENDVKHNNDSNSNNSNDNTTTTNNNNNNHNNDKHTPTYFSKYTSHKFWHNHVKNLISICSKVQSEWNSHNNNDKNDPTERDVILLQIIRTINNLSRDDICYLDTSSSCCYWYDLIIEFSLLDMIQALCTPGMNDIECTLEVILFCKNICVSNECAQLIASSRIISLIMQVWEYYDDDIHVQFIILLFCERLISFSETRQVLLIGTDALQCIFNCIGNKNRYIFEIAERCLDMIQECDRDDKYEHDHCNLEDTDGTDFLTLDRFAEMCIEKRFCFYNHPWINGDKDP